MDVYKLYEGPSKRYDTHINEHHYYPDRSNLKGRTLMDPLTQGVLGATLSQSLSKRNDLKIAGLLGVIGGISADLDVLIRSTSDPLLFLEYHRQFTHSLIFIPFGGLICCLLMYLFFRKRRILSFYQCWFYCTLGFSTHALIDACTSYGTQLLWPFSSERIAWDVISIIDPLYTLPLLLLVLYSLYKKNKKYSVIALIWALLYPTLGLIQRERVEQVAWQLANEKNLEVIRITAKPSFANLLVWKVIVQTENYFDIYAVRAGQQLKIYPGEKISSLKVSKDIAWLNPESQQARDIERFSFFSNDYIALDPNNSNIIIDIRYSMLPNTSNALWGIKLSPIADYHQHVEYVTQREMTKSTRDVFYQMIFNTYDY